MLFNIRNISEGEEYGFCDQQPCHVRNDYFNMEACLPAQTPTVAFTIGISIDSGGVTPTRASSEFGPGALFQCHQNTDTEAKLLWITFFKNNTLD